MARNGETDMTRNEMRTAKSETANCDLLNADCAGFAPTDEQIRSRAHEIYQARCSTNSDGDELADWVAAESELKARANSDQEPFDAVRRTEAPTEATNTARAEAHA